MDVIIDKLHRLGAKSPSKMHSSGKTAKFYCSINRTNIFIRFLLIDLKRIVLSWALTFHFFKFAAGYTIGVRLSIKVGEFLWISFYYSSRNACAIDDSNHFSEYILFSYSFKISRLKQVFFFVKIFLTVLDWTNVFFNSNQSLSTWRHCRLYSPPTSHFSKSTSKQQISISWLISVS